MELFEQFGFDIKLFVAQIVNFLVIAYLFKRFLYKPILDVLSKRNLAIKKGLKDAELATKANDEAQIQKDEILKKAGIEADRIILEAKNQAQEARDSLMEQTKNDIAKMMNSTKEQIEMERENFKKEAKDMSLILAQTILQNTITGLFDEKEKDALLKKGIQKIKNDKQSKN